MNTENNEDKPVIFNTPAGFNFEDLFSGLSIKFKPKVEFLIHQINYYDFKGGYQIHSKNHKWFFGIKGTELAMMLRKLVGSGIIKLVTNFTPGNTSNTYKMVRPFNIADPSTQKNFYYPHEALFIEKWIMDSYIVKSAATSKFKKERKITNAALITEQQKQITDLQIQVLELLKQSKSLTQPEVSGVHYCNPVQLSNGTLLVTTTPQNLVTEAVQATAPSPNLLVGESEEVQPQVPETIAQHDLFKVDEQEMADLALMFGDEPTPTPETRIIDLPSLKLPSTGSDMKAIIDVPIEQIDSERTVTTNGLPDKETFLNGSLTVHYVADGVVIENGDKLGVLKNFEGVKPWCEPMSDFEKQRFYDHLMTSTGRDVTFPLNLHTKALFTREVVDGDLLFTYQALSAA